MKTKNDRIEFMKRWVTNLVGFLPPMEEEEIIIRNEYKPWKKEGITELEYFKRRYLELSKDQPEDDDEDEQMKVRPIRAVMTESQWGWLVGNGSGGLRMPWYEKRSNEKDQPEIPVLVIPLTKENIEKMREKVVVETGCTQMARDILIALGITEKEDGEG